MPNPTPDFNYVQVVWRGTNLDGTAASGTIEITYDGPGPMLDPSSTAPISIFPVKWTQTIQTTQVNVDNALGQPVQVNVGLATFDIPVSNDPDIQGGGGTYTITERLNGATGRTYSFLADKDAPGGIINVNALAPIDPDPGTVYSVVTVTQFNALEARVTAVETGKLAVTGTPVAGYVPRWQVGGGAAWEALPGGGSYGVGTVRVYRSVGDTIAVSRDGSLISSLPTTPDNNTAVIQAAIDSIAGVYTPGTLTVLGHGGGGTVTLSDQLYEISSLIEPKYGVSLLGFATMDRNGFVASAHSYQGTVLAPTSALAQVNIAASGAAVNRTPVILFGRTQAANGTQSTTNPHGVRVDGIGFDMRRKTTAQGIVLADTQFVTITRCVGGEARGTGGVAVEIVSTNAPDDGAHGTHIYDNLFVNCEKGVVANGSGSTDSILAQNRILQMTKRTIEIGATGGGGGWQIAVNHLTTSSTDQTGANECHLYLSGAPCQVVGNYFDTTGGYAIYADSPLGAILGNYFKTTSTKLAPVYLDGNGRKSNITGNTMQAAASTKGFVQVSATTGVDYRCVVGNNIVGDGGNTALVSALIDGAGNAIAEADAAGIVDRSGGAINPAQWFNRFVASAV